MIPFSRSLLARFGNVLSARLPYFRLSKTGFLFAQPHRGLPQASQYSLYRSESREIRVARSLGAASGGREEHLPGMGRNAEN